MAQVVVLGAGLGGTIMAYELRDKLGKAHAVSAVTKGSSYHFVPSNPLGRGRLADRGQGAGGRGHLECRLPGGFRGRRVAFVAQPQIPPRNVNWSSSGKWVHAAKIGFEEYFLLLPAQDPVRQVRAVLRAAGAAGARDRQAEGSEAY